MDDSMIETGEVQDDSGSFVWEAREVLKDNGLISKGHRRQLKMVHTGQIYCKYI